MSKQLKLSASANCSRKSLERKNGTCTPSYHLTASENYFKLFISGNSAYINMA